MFLTNHIRLLYHVSSRPSQTKPKPPQHTQFNLKDCLFYIIYDIMNKQEITTNQNNDQAYQEYYERKRIAMVMEENNNSKIIAIPSLNKNAKDEWLKLGGNSAYFYKYFVAPRLNKKPPTIHQDTDFNHRFKSGIIAVHWKDAFIKNMKSLKLEPTEESGLLIFQLSHKYTKAEIKKLHAKENAANEKINQLLKPKITIPELYNQFLILAQTLPNKIRKLDIFYRQFYGAQMNNILIKLFENYIELSEGGDKDKIKQHLILYINHLNAILIILNENHALDNSTVERLGTLMVDIRNSITRNLK